MQSALTQRSMGVRCTPHCAQQLRPRSAQRHTVVARSAAAPRINAAAVLEPLEVATLPTRPLDHPVQQMGTVTELSIDNFHEFVEDAAAAGVPLVVDFFTVWCGPCKFIAPELVKMSSEMPGVRFAKFDCGANDKKFVKELGIKALPTFHMYKNGAKVDQFVGAKARELRRFVERHMPAPEGL